MIYLICSQCFLMWFISLEWYLLHCVIVFCRTIIHCVARGVASFSTSCRPGWLSFPQILKIVRMTSTHWPHQHLVTPKTYNFFTSGRVIQPKICRPGPTGLWAGYAPGCADGKRSLGGVYTRKLAPVRVSYRDDFFLFRIAFTLWLGHFISRYLKVHFMLINYT